MVLVGLQGGAVVKHGDEAVFEAVIKVLETGVSTPMHRLQAGDDPDQIRNFLQQSVSGLLVDVGSESDPDAVMNHGVGRRGEGVIR
jgi:hypothetical protein